MNIGLVLFAVIVACPSYVHIFLSKASDVEVFGFKNARIFWLATGNPLTILIFGMLAFIKINFSKAWIDKLFSYSVYSFFITGAFFTLKSFIPLNDLPKMQYVLMLLIASAIIVFGALFAVKLYKFYQTKKSKELTKLLLVDTWNGILPKALKTGFIAGKQNDLSTINEFKKEEEYYKQKIDKILADA